MTTIRYRCTIHGTTAEVDTDRRAVNVTKPPGTITGKGVDQPSCVLAREVWRVLDGADISGQHAMGRCEFERHDGGRRDTRSTGGNHAQRRRMAGARP